MQLWAHGRTPHLTTCKCYPVNLFTSVTSTRCRCDVLVASDAIGMGLNLAIKRVILTSLVVRAHGVLSFGGVRRFIQPTFYTFLIKPKA